MMSQESAITFWGVCSIITTIFTIFTLAAYIINRRRDEKKKREGIYISRLRGATGVRYCLYRASRLSAIFCRSMAPETNPYAGGYLHLHDCFPLVLPVACQRHVHEDFF